MYIYVYLYTNISIIMLGKNVEKKKTKKIKKKVCEEVKHYKK